MRIPLPSGAGSRAALRLAFAAALAFLPACRGAGDAAEAPSVAFPGYELVSLDGSTVSPERFAGRVVLYDFWATWCGPCHLQADILRELYPALQAKGIEIVGIATGEGFDVVRDFAVKRPFPWPVLVDPDEKLSTELEIVGLPTLVILNRKGGISFRQTGVADPSRLERELAKASGS